MAKLPLPAPPPRQGQGAVTPRAVGLGSSQGRAAAHGSGVQGSTVPQPWTYAGNYLARSKWTKPQQVPVLEHAGGGTGTDLRLPAERSQQHQQHLHTGHPRRHDRDPAEASEPQRVQLAREAGGDSLPPLQYWPAAGLVRQRRMSSLQAKYRQSAATNPSTVPGHPCARCRGAPVSGGPHSRSWGCSH